MHSTHVLQYCVLQNVATNLLLEQKSCIITRSGSRSAHSCRHTAVFFGKGAVQYNSSMNTDGSVGADYSIHFIFISVLQLRVNKATVSLFFSLPHIFFTKSCRSYLLKHAGKFSQAIPFAQTF